MKRNKYMNVLEDSNVGKLEVVLLLLYKDIICNLHFCHLLN